VASTKHADAIDIINRAHQRREPNELLDLLADDAELVQYDMDSLGEPRTLSGRDEIEPMMRDVFGRDMTHEVREMVVGEDRLSYMVFCEYPDGTIVVGSTVCDLRDGQIVRMVNHVSWTE
jgi:hypothetical protein